MKRKKINWWKKLLVKVASKIVHKYGIFYADRNSVIGMYDELFEVTNYRIDRSIGKPSKLNIEMIDYLNTNQLSFEQEYECEWIGK